MNDNPTHPGARRAAGAVWSAGGLVIHGGFGVGNQVAPDAISADLWRWDDRWERLAGTGPAPARYPSLCAGAGNDFFRFGGCGFDGRSPTFLDELWHWDGAWTEVATRGSRPAGRYTSAFAFHGGRLVMVGGHSQTPDGGKTFYGDLWLFEDGAWREIDTGGTGPGSRYGFGWVQRGADLFVFGGFDGRRDCGDFWRLALDTLTWTRLPDGPQAGYCPALGAVGDCIVLFGGRSKTDPKRNFDDTWLFEDVWRRHEGAGPGYHAKPGYASNGQSLWIFGGEGTRGHVSDLWRFGQNGWTRLDAGGGNDPILW